MQVTEDNPTSPYNLSQPPTSPGRALLSRAYEYFCEIHWGYSGDEIAAAFAGRNPSIFGDLEWSSRLLGELLARGDIRSWARAFGGGQPVSLKGMWELDEFTARFASSALNLEQPFDGNQAPTHWIFVDVGDWNGVVEEMLAAEPGCPAPSPVRGSPARSEPVGVSSAEMQPVQLENSDRFVRMPELIRRTGISKPTIYRRMALGRFPQNVLLDGNIAVWREHEIAAWIADPS